MPYYMVMANKLGQPLQVLADDAKDACTKLLGVWDYIVDDDDDNLLFAAWPSIPPVSLSVFRLNNTLHFEKITAPEGKTCPLCKKHSILPTVGLIPDNAICKNCMETGRNAK